MTIFSTIKQPTLILDEDKAKRNLSFIASKIKAQNIQFRPHFKTHQSKEIGNWFRDLGINKITVSSVEMAQYFAEDGWADILIAFPANILQLEEILALSSQITLSLLFENIESVTFIDQHLKSRINGWIKIDSGLGRCGLNLDQKDEIFELAKTINSSKFIHLQGLLTHAGHTYRVNKPDQIIKIYEKSSEGLNSIRSFPSEELGCNLKISVGDTPSARIVENFGQVDELRPGNFLFYDVQQYVANVCQLEDIAVCVACPVVAIHTNNYEVVVYGGAIHLSKDSHRWGDQGQAYGLVTFPTQDGWENKIHGYVKSLSQEHGVLVFPNGIPETLKIGSLTCILPAHSCLTVQAMRDFMNLDGEKISTLLS